MKFFSRIVFICNCCFIIAVGLRLYENAHKKDGNFNGAIQIQPLESTIVVLGYAAVFINLIFNLILLGFFITKKNWNVPRWLIWGNFILLLLQIYYFLFSNF
jgi:hypothetical protein